VVAATAITALVAAPPALAASPGHEPTMRGASSTTPSERAGVVDTLRLVSRGPDGAPGKKESYAPDLSGTGRFVSFHSKAALAKDDDNGVTDVYVYDRRTREMELISRTPTGDPGNGPSDSPRISRDGRYVVFQSAATNLVAGAKSGIYRFDRETGTTIYVAKDGFWPSMSDDGQVIGYDMPGGIVYVTDLQTGKQTLVSHAFDDPNRPVSESWLAEVSGNGRYVAFYCYYDEIVGDADDNGVRDAFRYDRKTGTSVLISRTPDGTSANEGSEDPALSTSGRYAVFWSSATDMVEDDLDGTWQVYVTDMRTGTVTLVSRNWRGKPGNDYSFVPTISGDGHRVAFSSLADLVKGATTVTLDVYVSDLTTGTTVLASHDPQGNGGDGWSQVVALDQHGDTVAFASEAANLIPDAKVRRYQIYVDRRPLD
jgi:Tol biopolymer transport system component